MQPDQFRKIGRRLDWVTQFDHRIRRHDATLCRAICRRGYTLEGTATSCRRADEPVAARDGRSWTRTGLRATRAVQRRIATLPTRQLGLDCSARLFWGMLESKVSGSDASSERTSPEGGKCDGLAAFGAELGTLQLQSLVPMLARSGGGA